MVLRVGTGLCEATGSAAGDWTGGSIVGVSMAKPVDFGNVGGVPISICGVSACQSSVSGGDERVWTVVVRRASAWWWRWCLASFRSGIWQSRHHYDAFPMLLEKYKQNIVTLGDNTIYYIMYRHYIQRDGCGRALPIA